MADFDMQLDTVSWQKTLDSVAALGDNVVNKVVGPAAKKALGAVERAAKVNLLGRNTSGLLEVSIGIVQRKRKARGTVYSIVGPRTGFKDPISGENPANISHLVEFGTRPHWIAPKNRAGVLKIKRGRGPTRLVKGAVWHPGARPKPFMRPAYDTHGRGVLRTMQTEMRVGVAKQAAKVARRGA